MAPIRCVCFGALGPLRFGISSRIANLDRHMAILSASLPHEVYGIYGILNYHMRGALHLPLDTCVNRRVVAKNADFQEKPANMGSSANSSLQPPVIDVNTLSTAATHQDLDAESAQKAHGMRSRGKSMRCPGRRACVYGGFCSVADDDPPTAGTLCAIEAQRAQDLRSSLECWVRESGFRPQVVDPEWMKEVAAAYIDAQIEADRLSRYLVGRGIVIPSHEYFTDPVVLRHGQRVARRRDELRFYLTDLILSLRRAKAGDRHHPSRGCRTRTCWWAKEGAKPAKSQRSPEGAGEEKVERAAKKSPRTGRRKPYRPDRVRRLIEQRRRAQGTMP